MIHSNLHIKLSGIEQFLNAELEYCIDKGWKEEKRCQKYQNMEGGYIGFILYQLEGGACPPSATEAKVAARARSTCASATPLLRAQCHNAS